MSDDIHCLVYSDIHHHEYANGLTGDDVEAVEEEACQLFEQYNCDFGMFLGDRFMSRNPLDRSRQRADRALKRKNDLGKPWVFLPGNHDQWTKNPYGGHSMGAASIFRGDLKNIHVFDTASTYVLSIKGQSFAIHGMPAGHAIPNFNFDKNIEWHIGIFHGMVAGSRYQNGVIAEEGMPPQVLDRSEFHLVLGGDNHAYQTLPFQYTKGLYVGAPMQHNWGDAGAKRGFVIVRFSKIDVGRGEFDYQTICSHIESHAPKFFKCQARIDELNQITEFIGAAGNLWRGNIIDLQLSGASDVLKDIIPHEWAEKIQKKVGARSVEIRLDFDMDRSVKVTPTLKSEAEEWEEYLATTGAPKGVDPEKLKKLGLYYISHA